MKNGGRDHSQIGPTEFIMRYHMKRRKTAKERVLSFLQKKQGRNTFSVAQGRNYFGIKGVTQVISDLRSEGYPIYTNIRRRGDGSKVKVYRLGTPSRSFLRYCKLHGVKVKLV